MDILNIINPQGIITLTINQTLLSPACTVWETSATIQPAFKWTDEKLYIPAKEMEHFFSHPVLHERD